MFVELIGNHSNVKTLADLKSGERFPHCIIISGAKGSGKKTFATSIAAAYFCLDKDAFYCGECSECHLVDKGYHPDLTIVSPSEESKSGMILIDQIREMKKQMAVRANQGRGRIFIINDAHRMQENASNALLKQIEEPVKGVLYILLCESEFLLLETVRSRGVIFRMPILTLEDCVQAVMASGVGEDRRGEVETLSRVLSGSVGAVKEGLSDGDLGDLLSSCTQLGEAAEGYNGFIFASILKKHEGKRPQYAQLLSLLRAYCSAELRNPNRKIEASRLVYIMGQLQWGIDRCKQNVVLPLLSVVLSEKICSRIY